MPYLLTQPNPTFTMITGGAGDLGSGGITAISQGALYSFANAAIKETNSTPVRFNEIYLNTRVDYDSVYEKQGNDKKPNFLKSSQFAKVYQQLWARDDIKSSRITVLGPADVSELKIAKKLK